MSKVGNSIGHFAMVDEEIKTCNISENNIGIKLKGYNTEFKYYLCTYLNSEFANNLILRRISGNAQPKINVIDMIDIPIPEFSIDYYKKIYNNINLAYKLRKEADSILNGSIKLLEEELKYNEKLELRDNITTNKLSNVFNYSNRIDAEFYQEKYNYYDRLIKEYKLGNDCIKNICSISKKNYMPKDDKMYKYIELSDIKNNGEIEELEEINGAELPTRARRLVKNGQVIISSIEGSIDSCALISEKQNNCICSTGFYIIESNKINSETLFILLKTRLFQEILKRYASGTILTSINIEDFENIRLPIIDEKIQLKIQDNIKRMYKIREKSKKILKIAEESIIIAVEKNEKEAINYLEKRSDE